MKVIALNFPSTTTPLNIVNRVNLFTNKCGEDIFEDAAIMSSGAYAKIFGQSKQVSSVARKRLSVVKIVWCDNNNNNNNNNNNKRHSIYRRYLHYNGFSGITDNMVVLSPSSIRELANNSQVVGKEVVVTPGCRFLYFWNHPFHATRISMKLGIVSIALAVVSISISILTMYC